MTNTTNYAGANWGVTVPPPAVDAGLMADVLAPWPVPRTPVRLPRSVRRPVGDGDLQAAADMLAKLRRRDDCRKLAAGAPPADADRALDVAVDRLLMVL